MAGALMMKRNGVFIGLVFFVGTSFAADRDSTNLQVLSDADYRQPLIEVVVRSQSIAPDWNVESVSVTTVELPNSRLQWFPRYDPAKPVQPTSVNPNDEQPLIKIFQKIF
jgi:hypothetical protein